LKFTRQLFFILVFAVAFGAQAASTPLLDEALNSQTVFSGAAITTGTSIRVGGNLQAAAAVNLGADSVIGGNFKSGPGAHADLAVNAQVGGNAEAGNVLTLGASARVIGNATSRNGPVVLGAASIVSGNATAGTVVTLSPSASVGGLISEGTVTAFETDIDSQKAQLQQAQDALNGMPTTATLAPVMTISTTLLPGVYGASALTTTAGITITLDGNNETGFWVFNMDTYISFGAGLTIELLNVTPDSTIIWNSGGYTTVGANSILRGTIIAGSYITTGAGATLNGVDADCGGIFTISGAVNLGASNIMGAEGCIVGAINNFILADDGAASFFVESDVSADAGTDQAAAENTAVTLVAAGDGIWTQTGGPALEPAIDSANPSFTAPLVNADTTLSFTLTAANGTTDTVVITVTDVAGTGLVANAGPDQSVSEGDIVTLIGSDSGSGTYAWEQIAVSDAAGVLLDDSTAANPIFAAPRVDIGGQTLTFLLTFTDNNGTITTDTVNIHVKNVNTAPIAIAGESRSIAAWSELTLNGSGSYDPDGETLSYQWTQRQGDGPVTVADDNSLSPSFTDNSTAELVFLLAVQGELVFDLTVTDGTVSSVVDSVTINIIAGNNAPVADAGVDQTANEISLVELDAQGSNDADGDTLTYGWTQIGGTEVITSNSDSSTLSFTSPYVIIGGEDLIFEVTVTDSNGGTTSDQVTIHVRNVGDVPNVSNAQPSDDCLWPPNHKLVPIEITGISGSDDATTITFDSVTQDEATDSQGNGDTETDAVIRDGILYLRAERFGTGDGRVYRVGFTASNEIGSASGTVNVRAPLNQGSDKLSCIAIDSGQKYTSTGTTVLN